MFLAKVLQEVLGQGRVTSSVSVRMATGFWSDTLNPSVLGVINLNRGDSRLSPKLEYFPADAVTLTLEADFFWGPTGTLYGQFRTNDRLSLDVSWRF